MYAASDPGASGLPLLEAMATGTPVVAVAGSPATELIRDGVTGFVCSSLGEMAGAIDAVAKLERKAARTHVARRFSPAALARSYEQVYARLLVEASHTNAPTPPPQNAKWVARAADSENGILAFADGAAGWGVLR